MVIDNCELTNKIKMQCYQLKPYQLTYVLSETLASNYAALVTGIEILALTLTEWRVQKTY